MKKTVEKSGRWRMRFSENEFGRKKVVQRVGTRGSRQYGEMKRFRSLLLER